jgi:hypothetical protein
VSRDRCASRITSSCSGLSSGIAATPRVLHFIVHARGAAIGSVRLLNCGVRRHLMRNVFWLRQGVLAGRSGPNRDAWSPKELADGGIGAVLSVNDGELVHSGDLGALGINYSCISLSDAAPPQPGDLQACVDALPKALTFVLSSIESGRSVLVHCSSGKDRTGMFLTYYLCATEGLAPARAIEEVRRVRPVALSAEGWESFTLDVLRVLVPDQPELGRDGHIAVA